MNSGGHICDADSKHLTLRNAADGLFDGLQIHCSEPKRNKTRFGSGQSRQLRGTRKRGGNLILGNRSLDEWGSLACDY